MEVVSQKRQTNKLAKKEGNKQTNKQTKTSKQQQKRQVHGTIPSFLCVFKIVCHTHSFAMLVMPNCTAQFSKMA